mmetsp:Transcript_3321/g.10375  ORF Transcript_3321/g.10375 Transcript_3321/m.10375 type:complete len:222 (-) Transcript_3321:902-1567(-)
MGRCCHRATCRICRQLRAALRLRLSAQIPAARPSSRRRRPHPLQSTWTRLPPPSSACSTDCTLDDLAYAHTHAFHLHRPSSLPSNTKPIAQCRPAGVDPLSCAQSPCTETYAPSREKIRIVYASVLLAPAASSSNSVSSSSRMKLASYVAPSGVSPPSSAPSSSSSKRPLTSRSTLSAKASSSSCVQSALKGTSSSSGASYSSSAEGAELSARPNWFQGSS